MLVNIDKGPRIKIKNISFNGNEIHSDNKLKREFVFKDFKEAISFINKISIIAEKNDHHPEIFNVYNKVIITLCTHDKGSIITDKDYNLANKIDELL